MGVDGGGVGRGGEIPTLTFLNHCWPRCLYGKHISELVSVSCIHYREAYTDIKKQDSFAVSND